MFHRSIEHVSLTIRFVWIHYEWKEKNCGRCSMCLSGCWIEAGDTNQIGAIAAILLLISNCDWNVHLYNTRTNRLDDSQFFSTERVAANTSWIFVFQTLCSCFGFSDVGGQSHTRVGGYFARSLTCSYFQYVRRSSCCCFYCGWTILSSSRPWCSFFWLSYVA